MATGTSTDAKYTDLPLIIEEQIGVIYLGFQSSFGANLGYANCEVIKVLH